MSTLVPVGEGVRTRESRLPLINRVEQETSIARRVWYAVYTRSRFEQVVKKQLDSKGIGNFLPLYSTVCQWKDRKQEVFRPLFPGYLFVSVIPAERVDVQRSFGVVNLVGNGQGPVEVAEQQINAIRTFVETGLKCDPHPYLRIGKRVRVIDGPLAGIEGILVRKKNRSLFVISVEMIQRSVSVELECWKIAAV